jgi:amidase
VTAEIEEPMGTVTRRFALMAAAGSALACKSLGARASDGTTQLDFASAAEAARAIRTGRIGARELTQRMLDRIQLHNPRLGAMVNVLADQALAEATRIDASRCGKEAGGLLHGVPIVVKDAFEIAGVPTTGGIKQLAQYRPANDSEVVRRLRAAGAIVLGNTNVPFVLNDWQSYNDIYGTTNNPWDLGRTPGGSSGGSAAALAAGLGYFSPGSDRSGSLRIPASFCGVYAHKPSRDVVPLRGWFPSPPGSAPQLADLISVAGPMARTAADLKIGMQVMGGPDGDDANAYRWTMPAPRRTRLSDYRVGYVLDDPACPVDPSVRERMEAAVAALGRAGARLKQGWPAGIDPVAQYRTYLYMLFCGIGTPPGIKPEDMRPLAARDDGSLASIFAQTMVDPISRFIDHERDQQHARAAWRAAFQEYDVFLMPTSFVAAFPHDHSEPQQARRLMTQAGPRPYTDLFFWIAFANIACLPATAAPIGRTAEGLPVGLQILGPYLEDATPIDFAERAAEVLGGFVPPPGLA